MDSHEELIRKQKILRREAKFAKVQLRVHDSSGSWLEGVLARGDRSLADVIESAWTRGARFDSWGEKLQLDAWEAAFEDCSVSTEAFLGTLPTSARLPWDHIDVGLEEGFLAKEYRKALKNRLSPPCGKVAGTFVHHTNLRDASADSRRLVCYDCGVACDMGKMRNDRLISLERLGANTPRTTTSLPILETVTPDANTAVDEASTPAESEKRDRRARRRDLDRLPMAGEDQGPPTRIRIGFEKVGRIAYSSHLDLVRLFPRWFKRARLPVFWSGGFHPRPQMTFSPALSLGISSTGEYIDLKLRRRDLSPELEACLLERLQSTAFEGINVFGVQRLGDTDPSLGRVLGESVWVAAIPKQVLTELTIDDQRGFESSAHLQSHVDEKRGGSLTVMRYRKGIGRTIDVGRALTEAVVGNGRETLTAAGLVGDLVPFRFATDMHEKGTAKPTEVIEAIFGEIDVRLVREGVYARIGGKRISPLDLQGIRRAQRELRAEI